MSQPTASPRPAPLALPVVETGLMLTEAEEIAVRMALPARARYQQEYARGLARVSGSDLTGKARTFGGRYAEARRVVESTVESITGEPLVPVIGTHGRTSLWTPAALLAHYSEN